MLWKLGLRVPIVPLKGYSFTTKREDVHKFKHCHLDKSNNIGLTVWKDKIRWTSFSTDISGLSYDIPQ